MSTAHKVGQFSLKCLDPRMRDSLILDKKKVIVGSHESCDFKVDDRSVSSYHAFLCLKGEEGFMVKDLYSESGVYLNGRRVEEAFVNPGDVLTIGTLSFAIEMLEDSVPVFNPDETISPVSDATASFELPTRPGLIFIDGEYCDIEFDDSRFKPLSVMPQLNFERDYIELEDTIPPLEIVHNIKDMRLEIVSYVNGLMMDVEYCALNNGDYFLTGEKKSSRDIIFHTLERIKIFTIKKGELRFYPTEAVTPSVGWDKIALTEALFLTHGTEQISLRFVDKTHKWRGIPLFYRDREFLKQSGKVFAGFILPFLLLLFVTVPTPEPVAEEVATVYIKPKEKIKPKEETEDQERKEVAAVDPTPQQENTGHKPEPEQDKTKVEMAEASKPAKAVAVKPTPVKPTPKVAAPNPTPAPPAPTVANTPPAPAPSPVQAPPTPAPPRQTYKFKSSVAVSALAGGAPQINTAASGGAGSARNIGSFNNAGSADNGQLVGSANMGVSKFNNGSDKSGSGKASYGSQGLANKKGYDSSYMEPKTVVMGSMDPELLRKILREYIPQFRHCYQQELIGQNEKIKGVIDLNFTISQEGRVIKHNIRAKDARFSKNGVGCMARVLSLIDFPKPKGGGVVDVRQPLNFFSETEKI